MADNPAPMGTDIVERLRSQEPASREEAAREIERLRAALSEIAHLPEAPSLHAGGYGDGYNAARDTAADIALTALEMPHGR